MSRYTHVPKRISHWFNRIRHKQTRKGELQRGRQSRIESLEVRQMLSANDPVITDFSAFGQDRLDLDKNGVVIAGLLGSGDVLNTGKDVETLGLSGGGKLNLGKNALVTGDVVFDGKLSVEKDAVIVGNLDSNTKIELDKDVFVDGDATSAGIVDLSSGVMITGTITEFGTPELFAPITLPTATSFTTNPSNDIETDDDETTTLAPGAYGDLELDKDNVLNLSAGSYFFDKINVDKNLELNLDVSGGNIEIFVAGKVTFAKELDANVIGGDASDIYLESHDRFLLDKDGEWFGTIYAPDDKIELLKNTTLVGAAYSGTQVLISPNSILELVAADRLLGNVEIDPPILTVGLANDTGDNNTDGVTADPTLSGSVTDESGVDQLLLTITSTSGGATGGPFDITANVNIVDGSFSLDRVALEALLGQTLVDGDYTATFVATDTLGNSTSTDVVFLLDTLISAEIDLTTPPAGLVTNDNVTISGQITDPSAVTLLEAHIDSDPYVSIPFDAAGNFSFNSTLTLDGTADGTHTIRLRLRDAAGNVSALLERDFVLDTVISTPTITEYEQDTGDSDTDGITSDTRLMFSGTAEANSTVTVSEATIGAVGSAVTDGTGQWTVDATGTILADGSYTFTATAQDVAGNISAASAAVVVQVDTIAPTITLNSPAEGLVTNDNVTVAGEVTDPAGVTLLEAQIDGGAFTVVAVDGANQFSFDTAFALDGSADGSHTLRLRATDVAGNVTEVVDMVERTFELDTQISTPLITDFEQDTGSSNSDGITNDNTLVFSGIADANNAVTISEAGLGTIGSTTADGSGNWTLDASATALAEGSYQFSAVAVDSAGNTSAVSAGLVVEVDTTAPVITVNSPTDGSVVNDNVVVAGDVIDPSGVTLLEAQIDSGAFTALTVDGAGLFSFTTAFALDGTADGNHTVRLRAIDVAGNITSLVERTFEFDTQVSIPVIVDFEQDTGTNDSDGITNDNTLVFSGTADPDSVVTISEAGLGAIGSTSADASGDWTLDASAAVLSDGSYSFTATAQDSVGNTSAVSATLVVNVDTTAAAITINSPTQGAVVNNNMSVAGEVTDLSGVTLLEAQIDSGAFTAVTVDGAGLFNFVTTFALDGTADGSHTIRLRATDVAGNVTGLAERTFELDTQVSAPVITDFEQDSGSSDVDGITNDNTLVFSGIADANSIVTLSEAGLGTLASAATDVSGNWTIDASTTILADGNYSFTATAQDSIGNTSAPSAALAVDVDTSAPSVTINSPADGLVTNDNVTVLGQATDPSGVTLLEGQIDSGVFTAVAVDGAGLFSFVTTFALDGTADSSHTVRLRATDAAGNVTGLVERTFELDTQISTPVIADFEEDTGASDTDGITSDNMLVFSGAADPNSVVTVSEAGIGLIGTVTTDGSGNWTIDASGTVLADGSYSYTATATDAAGNTSGVSTPLTVVVDTTAPAPAVFDLDPIHDSSPVGDQQTTSSIVTLTGTTTPNVSVELVETGEIVTADANGVFNLYGVPLLLGNNDFTTRVVDTAGNSALSSLAITRLPEVGDLVLQEDNRFVTDSAVTVTLGQQEGTRTLRFEVVANFDTTDTSSAVEDALLVYLVDPADPTQTLLDRGEPGTALFMLAGDRVELAPGIVTFDESFVEIDVTSLASLTEGLLVFQLLGSDSDSGTQVAIANLTNTVDPLGISSSPFEANDILVDSGDALDLTVLTPTTEVQPLVENIRFDSTAGIYTAELRLKNDGTAIGRTAAVVFEGLPTGVTLLDAVGTDAAGSPYVNMTNSIADGGLLRGATSSGVLIQFDNPSLLRFGLQPQVLLGAPNQAPVVDPIGSQTASPGGVAKFVVQASDPDNDFIAVRMESTGELPTSEFRNGVLTFQPGPKTLELITLVSWPVMEFSKRVSEEHSMSLLIQSRLHELPERCSM